MKLAIFAVCFALLGATSGVNGLIHAHARVNGGGGNGPKYFQIYSQIDFVEQHRWALDVATGSPQSGWVYGNRLHYQCVFWFLYEDGQPVAKIQYQRATNASYLKITDKFGSQHPFQPGEECGGTEEYVQNKKPAGLLSTSVIFQSGGTNLNSLMFPSTSPINPNVWFELDEQSADQVKVEEYNLDTTIALITITRLDPGIDLTVTQT